MTCLIFWISLILAATILAVVIGGLWNRISTEKGIGWQFIRFLTIGTSLPLTGILALNDALEPEIMTFLATIVGYAFGKTSEHSGKE